MHPDSAAEYQYFLKDHLGNNRVVFTASPAGATTITAGFENADQAVESPQFLTYGPVISGQQAHTGNNSLWLLGASGSQIGAAQSYHLMAGDKLELSGYGISSYNCCSYSSNYQNLAMALLSAFHVLPPGPGETNSAGIDLNWYGTVLKDEDNVAGSDQGPARAFFNIIVFDENFNFVDAVYQQIPQDDTWDFLDISYIAKGGSYAYVYVANEDVRLSLVYVDDITITYTPSPVVQVEDYYPFGASFNSYTRENSVANKYKFQHKEYQEDLGLNLYDFGGRQYDPWAVFTTTPDPHAQKYLSTSPYSWAGGNPLKFIDPTGKDIILVYKDDKKQNRYYDYKNGSTYKGSNQFIKNFYAAVGKLNEKGVGGTIQKLENNKQQYHISEGKGKEETRNTGTHSMVWNPNQGIKTDKGVGLSATSALNHEADHGLNELTKPVEHAMNTLAKDTQYDTKEERRVITGSEQATAIALGEIKPGQVTRENHRGTTFPTAGPTTNVPLQSGDN